MTVTDSGVAGVSTEIMEDAVVDGPAALATENVDGVSRRMPG